jgi:hypothetical protein
MSTLLGVLWGDIHLDKETFEANDDSVWYVGLYGYIWLSLHLPDFFVLYSNSLQFDSYVFDPGP